MPTGKNKKKRSKGTASVGSSGIESSNGSLIDGQGSFIECSTTTGERSSSSASSRTENSHLRNLHLQSGSSSSSRDAPPNQQSIQQSGTLQSRQAQAVADFVPPPETVKPPKDVLQPVWTLRGTAQARMAHMNSQQSGYREPDISITTTGSRNTLLNRPDLNTFYFQESLRANTTVGLGNPFTGGGFFGPTRYEHPVERFVARNSALPLVGSFLGEKATEKITEKMKTLQKSLVSLSPCGRPSTSKSTSKDSKTTTNDGSEGDKEKSCRKESKGSCGQEFIWGEKDNEKSSKKEKKGEEMKVLQTGENVQILQRSQKDQPVQSTSEGSETRTEEARAPPLYPKMTGSTPFGGQYTRFGTPDDNLKVSSNDVVFDYENEKNYVPVLSLAEGLEAKYAEKQEAHYREQLAEKHEAAKFESGRREVEAEQQPRFLNVSIVKIEKPELIPVDKRHWSVGRFIPFLDPFLEKMRSKDSVGSTEPSESEEKTAYIIDEETGGKLIAKVDICTACLQTLEEGEYCYETANRRKFHFECYQRREWQVAGYDGFVIW